MVFALLGVALLLSVAVQNAGAQYGGLLVSATSDTPILPGQPLHITVVVRNTSSETWEPGIDLEFSWLTQLDNPSWCPTCQPFGVATTEIVPVGATASMVVTLQPADLPGAPGNYSVDVAAAYNWLDVFLSFMDGSPKTVNFTISAAQTNHAPAIAAIGDQVVVESNLLSFTITATDADVPPQSLAYTLDPGAPPGASINPTNGVFTWTPPSGAAPVTNQITVRVTDDGSPPLSSTSTFDIVVLPPPRIEAVASPSPGVFVFGWQAFPGLAYRVDYRDEAASGPWSALEEGIIATGPTAWSTNSMAGAAQRFYRVVLLR